MSALALTALSLSQFRSHRALSLTLDPRPVAIFGPNGSGKTNILEAISLLSPGRGLRRAATEDLARRPDPVGWRVRGEVEGFGVPHELETGAEPGSSRYVRIDGKSAPQIALGRILRVVWTIPAMDRLWIEGADGRRRFLDRIALGFEPAHGEAVLTYEKAMRERNRLLKDERRDDHWYQALELQMAEAGAAMHGHRLSALDRITAAQDGSATSFPAADLGLLSPDGETEGSWDAEDLREALAAGRARDMAAGRTLTGPHRSDFGAVYRAKSLPARDCSTGEQKALLLSLVLSTARALASEVGTPPLLLLDEVTAHLDADRQAQLYDEIVALGAQAWMTGTGPEMFTALADRTQRLEVSEVDGKSDVKQV